jgi:hypothetical protein
MPGHNRPCSPLSAALSVPTFVLRISRCCLASVYRLWQVPISALQMAVFYLCEHNHPRSFLAPIRNVRAQPPALLRRPLPNIAVKRDAP